VAADGAAPPLQRAQNARRGPRARRAGASPVTSAVGAETGGAVGGQDPASGAEAIAWVEVTKRQVSGPLLRSSARPDITNYREPLESNPQIGDER
jgi:predicted TIM-barrel enzyme